MEADDSNEQYLTRSASRTSLDESISWYHGKITREAAEYVLSANGNEEGLFLVRESTSSPGDYVLSLIHEGSAIHYQIRRHGGDAFFSIDDGPIVQGLEMLISYYQEDQDMPVKLLQMCKQHPPPAETRRHGRTNLLHRATKEGELNVARELLKSDYNIDAKNQEGQTALHMASVVGCDDILKLLLEKKANPNLLDSAGLSPLHYATQKSQISTISLLIKYGADVQLRASRTGWVALHFAATLGNAKVIQVLLDFKAPCFPRSNYNETPLEIAVNNGFKECVDILNHHVLPPPLCCRADWFHEDLDRCGTMNILNSAENLVDGSFLVRRSSRKQDIYVLAVVSNSHVYSYEIKKQDEFYYIDDGPYFTSLEYVIDYYCQRADGLPVTLSIPVPQTLPTFKSSSETTKESYANLNNNLISDTSVRKMQTEPEKYKPYSKPNLICLEDLIIGPQIGEGEFGKVMKGKWKRVHNKEVEVAVKTLQNEQIQGQKEEFEREIKLMIRLDHKCIVKLLGVCMGPPLMMVQELVSMGSLLDYLLKFPNYINLRDMLLWSAQISWGMSYLETKRFVHRDLAARNILLNSKHEAKISDFGLSRALAVQDFYQARPGGIWPVKWYALESLLYGTFSHASDVWSYGITLWEIFTKGLHPYGEQNATEIVGFLQENKRLEIPKLCPDKLKKVIQYCWLPNPSQRPTFEQLYDMFCSDSDYAIIWSHILI